MLETATQIFFGKHPWSAFIYFVLGVLAGGFIGIRYSFRAQRPRLLIVGGSSGGDPPSWSLTVTNYPSFLGQRVDGASAQNVRAQLDVIREPRNAYPLLWNDQSDPNHATIQPGQQRSLRLFQRDDGNPGYFVADSSGKPVARFHEYTTRFQLSLADHLERVTTFPFIVEYDDTRLNATPTLRIVHRVTLADRWRRLGTAWQRVKWAFSSR